MDDRTLKEMLGYFRSMYGISEENLEIYVGVSVEGFGADEVDQLRELLLHLRTGSVDPNDFALTQMEARIDRS